MLLPGHKTDLVFKQGMEKLTSITFTVKNHDGHLDKLILPLFAQAHNVAAQIALAFLDLKVHNTAAAVTGYQVCSTCNRHAPLGIVTRVDLFLAGIGQKMPVGKPQPHANKACAQLMAEKILKQPG